MAEKAVGEGAGMGDVPKDWLPGLKQNFKFDIQAGFILFLIALPLSLGIAVASEAPPIAGVITAIIGGIVGSLLGGSYVTINGAAAGLIVIVVGAITGLGTMADGSIDLMAGYKYALAVGVVCGVIQIVLGVMKLGKLSNLFPLSVVHGMLAGIGIIIMSKQIHTLLGVSLSKKGNPENYEALHSVGAALHDAVPAPLGTLLAEGMLPTISMIPNSFATFYVPAAIIGALSLAMMILWPRLPKALTKVVPAPMAIILITVPLGMLFKLEPKYLVSVPLNFIEGISYPDFGKVGTGVFWKFVVMYVFVASIESILTASAIDKMDPWKRRSNMNRELVAKGVGNGLASMIGGLPMIAEVVRSSANIMNGARTRWSNFFHGSFMLVSVVTIPFILNMIPLAALAGMLVFIGFRLAHPKEFVHAAHVGKEEVAYMVVTAVVVVSTDLLVGVATGVLVAMIVNIVRGGTKNFGKAQTRIEARGDNVTLTLSGTHIFSNFMGTRGILDGLPPGKALTIDYSDVTYMDHTVNERFHDFDGEYSRTGGSVREVGKERLSATSHSNVSALIRA